MKKRIIVFGGSMFINMGINKGNYVLKKNKMISKLEEKFILDNFSNSSLTTETSLKYLKEFTNNRKYDSCIISLGEADVCHISPSNFKMNLMKILDVLRNKQIRPLLVSLPDAFLKSEAAKEYQAIIDTIALEEKVEYIYNGDTDMEVYKVKNASQMKRAILELCA